MFKTKANDDYDNIKKEQTIKYNTKTKLKREGVKRTIPSLSEWWTLGIGCLTN
jgi:hypothetical protein